MRVIVTRPSEDADALRIKLESLGHRVISSPLLDIVPIADAVIPEVRYQLVAFTSANGGRVVSGHEALARLRSLPAFTVGPQSADAARQAGFTDVHVAGSDAAGLADHIARSRDPGAGPILYVSGRDSASDFAGRLEAAGFIVCRVIAYEARPAYRLASEVRLGADAVLLFSPRTARIWAELIAHEGLEATARAMMHVCISQNAAAALPQAYARQVAGVPTETAMLTALAGLDTKAGNQN
jgi:uroporphyrinogen-III synthase